MQQLPKLCSKTIELLKTKKNLLAYSAGSDSNALFFVLLANDIPFDIAIVNYKTREQSDEEESLANILAKEYDKECFSLTCKLKHSNFEHNARLSRYYFFDKIIETNNYDNLITAHHLNDKLEWFFMQLSKGAGAVELLGMREYEKRKTYQIIRPFINTSKDEIRIFLRVNNIKHFLDKSNNDLKYKRNKIRHSYVNSFIKEYKEGIKKSFTYLQNDADMLEPKDIKQIQDLYLLKRYNDDLVNIRGIDKIVKKLGVLLSKNSRDEILRTKNCVISSKIVIEFNELYIFICPKYDATMDKKFKEKCRIAKIPKKIRTYLFAKKIEINHLLMLIS